jgi:hypothetical protein
VVTLPSPFEKRISSQSYLIAQFIPHRKHSKSSLLKTGLLAQFREIISTSSENDINYVNIFRAKNGTFFSIKLGGTCSNYCTLKGLIIMFSELFVLHVKICTLIYMGAGIFCLKPLIGYSRFFKILK